MFFQTFINDFSPKFLNSWRLCLYFARFKLQAMLLSVAESDRGSTIACSFWKGKFPQWVQQQNPVSLFAFSTVKLKYLFNFVSFCGKDVSGCDKGEAMMPCKVNFHKINACMNNKTYIFARGSCYSCKWEFSTFQVLQLRICVSPVKFASCLVPQNRDTNCKVSWQNIILTMESSFSCTFCFFKQSMKSHLPAFVKKKKNFQMLAVVIIVYEKYAYTLTGPLYGVFQSNSFSRYQEFYK